MAFRIIIFSVRRCLEYIEEKISQEVKENLQSSVLNIVLLSADYYQSSYCQNESGIIWFLDTEKIVIALPEIDERLMEGFLNSEHKIRRLDKKNDIAAICDIVRKFFPNLVSSSVKLNANIDRLNEQYNEVLKTRKVSSPTVSDQNNKLESKILSNEFSDEELLILYFFYDTQTNSVNDDFIELDHWLNKKEIVYSVKNGFDVLVDDDIIHYIGGNVEQQNIYKMFITSYRELRRLSKKSIDIFEQNCLKHKEATTSAMSKNPIENLIIKGFTVSEILHINYIIDLHRENLYAGWQCEKEVKMIQNWEEIHTLNDCLSNNYEDAISKLAIRMFIEASAKTSYGNTKEYRIKDIFLKSISTLGEPALEKLHLVMIENKYVEDKLPF